MDGVLENSPSQIRHLVPTTSMPRYLDAAICLGHTRFFALEITERDSFRLFKTICSLDWSQAHIRTPMTEAYQPRLNMRRREAQAYRTLNLVSSGSFGFLLFVMD